jgi:hypothetical protein
MHFGKTLFVALLRLSSYAFAAPVEATSAVDATAAVNAAPADS